MLILLVFIFILGLVCDFVEILREMMKVGMIICRLNLVYRIYEVSLSNNFYWLIKLIEIMYQGILSFVIDYWQFKYMYLVLLKLIWFFMYMYFYKCFIFMKFELLFLIDLNQVNLDMLFVIKVFMVEKIMYFIINEDQYSREKFI